MAGNLKWTNL